MSWRDHLRIELTRATHGERSDNPGFVRTCLRRAVGHAVSEWQRRDASVFFGKDFLSQLRGLASSSAVPETVRKAADRLSARLRKDFQSRSETPLEDAKIILNYVLAQMGESPEIS